MVMQSKFYIVLCVFWLLLPPLTMCQTVEVKEGFFFLDGKKFFIKGIGYEVGATPGILPWEHTFDPDQLHFDINRILSGGYNTIRTWAALTDEELTLLQQYDIKIIMGIWIDPHGDFADPGFIDNAKSIVTDVLNYSRSYDNIIAYLIMNEPLPEDIARAGYNETVFLWSQLINIIHTKHPDRPVCIANTCNGTFIDSQIFDFSAYNVYIYNPVTVNYLHGYMDYVSYLKQLSIPIKPLVITEYGLSVSPSGPGNWGYGGNSLIEQVQGDVFMYKSLVDGGASGSCIFNYSDGWWKSGNEFQHDDYAEEWFGLVEYTNLSDNLGQERPIWDAVKNFQSAIITQPHSSEIYNTKVPFEVFLNDTIERIEILLEDEIVYQKQVDSDYFLDTILFETQDVVDALLVFNCYAADNNLIKSEEKSILITTNELTLPTIDISIENDNFWQSGTVEVNYQINRESEFESDDRLDYVFYPHIGFDYGQSYNTIMPISDTYNFSSWHNISSVVDVFTVGAAFNITYNGFKKRIVNQLTLSRLNGSPNNVANEIEDALILSVFPNPAHNIISLKFDDKVLVVNFKYAIYNSMGAIVKHVSEVSMDQPIDIISLSPGVYYIEITLSDEPLSTVKKIVKI